MGPPEAAVFGDVPTHLLLLAGMLLLVPLREPKRSGQASPLLLEQMECSNQLEIMMINMIIKMAINQS